MAQENTHNEKMAELAKHKDGHIAYWKAHNGQTDPKRFEDGFIQGWCDAENKSFPNINRDSMLAQRKGENIAHCGNSPQEWAFEHGYHEGFDSRRCLAPKPAPPAQENTHEQKMAEMCKHKDGHIAYWKAHGNKPTDPKRFEDGFIQGWCDCEHHLADNNMTANSLIGQRHQEHVKSHGDSPCEWAYDDGYREGWGGRMCMKPPQKPAAPPAAEPPKVSDCPPTQAPPVNVATVVPPAAPPKPAAPQEPPKASDCPPTSAPPVNVAPVPPPANPPQPSTPQQPPKPADCPPADAPPKPTTAPVPAPPAAPTQPPAPAAPPKAAECPPADTPPKPTTAPVPQPPATPAQPPAPTAPPKVADCPPTEAAPKPAPPPAPVPPTTTQQNPVPTPNKPADCPPGTTNATATQPTPAPPAKPAPPPNTQQNPAPNPPKAADCPPGNTTTTQAPPSTSAPPAKPTPPPTTQQNPAPTKAADCGTSKPTTSAPAAPPPVDNHCHTPAADLPANHQCTSECNHGKKQGILDKIEHALNIK